MGVRSKHEVKELAGETVETRVEIGVEIGTSNVRGRDDGGDSDKRRLGSIGVVDEMCQL